MDIQYIGEEITSDRKHEFLRQEQLPPNPKRGDLTIARRRHLWLCRCLIELQWPPKPLK
ncbi:hypothetical protein CCACVL1_12229 [Corchorus capsularis]|uniref:Uncharacterized protein n=1 Tax=Corchorus capsularis TaxID=210143 RepID=A0A1R3IGT0_COCAP|nr:hypothetical protein CCACVL1_12229 [Corchorus capsularis]